MNSNIGAASALCDTSPIKSKLSMTVSLQWCRHVPNHAHQRGHAADVEAAIIQAKQSKKPFLIDAVVSSGELMMPPLIQMDQAVGMTESNLKQAMMALSGDHQQWQHIWEEIATYFDSADE